MKSSFSWIDANKFCVKVKNWTSFLFFFGSCKLGECRILVCEPGSKHRLQKLQLNFPRLVLWQAHCHSWLDPVDFCIWSQLQQFNHRRLESVLYLNSNAKYDSLGVLYIFAHARATSICDCKKQIWSTQMVQNDLPKSILNWSLKFCVSIRNY